MQWNSVVFLQKKIIVIFGILVVGVDALPGQRGGEIGKEGEEENK